MSLISKGCFDQSDDARLAQLNAKLRAISSSSGTSSSPTNPTPNEPNAQRIRDLISLLEEYGGLVCGAGNVCWGHVQPAAAALRSQLGS
jgi:hypothetical protein